MGAPAVAFIITPSDPDPWLTAASGTRSGNGAPATITWSIVPDGTTVERSPGSRSPSNLIAFMNTNFGGSPAESDLTLQPWFHIFTDAFGRWSELGGVNYVFESHDDGQFHPSANGALGVRGDIRIGGINIDGVDDTLAFTYVTTEGSDMTIDTAEVSFYSDSSNNFVNFRNTLLHEIGHTFGLEHVSTSSKLLMEPFIDTSFDGPQLDEVRGVQFFFGDANEKSNGGLGNNVAARATALGALSPGGTRTIGAAANLPTQAISPAANDFVSIANVGDTDFYSFSIGGPSQLASTLTPRGGVFTQGAADFGETPTSFNANARNNLALSIFSTDGTTVIATADATAAGSAESIANLVLPAGGTYFARVTGADDTVQLYQLSLTPTPILVGDYNNNGVVDGADYVLWRNSEGQSVTLGSGADGNFDGQITAADYNVWRSQFGQIAANGSSVSESVFAQTVVPDPTTIWWALVVAAAFAPPRRRYSKRRVTLQHCLADA
jgi:hypothetical protein